MKQSTPALEIQDLVYRYGRTEAVHGISLKVEKGKCFGFFGRNGAGKTTTIKCLLNLLQPRSGAVRILGMDPALQDLEVKSRISYVPDQVGFYPWMTVQDTFNYLASYRPRWNVRKEADLLGRFELDRSKKISSLSKGQRTQVALIAAICPEPEVLILDEPTSGLDPIVRKEFIQSVIGAYQEDAPGERTILVSTHLITEFEGLIDEFCVMDEGRIVLTIEADAARERFKRIRARFPQPVPLLDFPEIIHTSHQQREMSMVVEYPTAQLFAKVNSHRPEHVLTEGLTLEEIFVATLQQKRRVA